MTRTLEEILKQVAAGELDPEQALPLIDAAERSAHGPAGTATPEPEPAWGTPGESAPGRPGQAETTAPGTSTSSSAGGSGTGSDGEGPVTGLRVRSAFQAIDVYADPAVSGAHVTGAHTARREGGLLVVESPDLPPRDPDRAEREPGGWFSFTGLSSLTSLASLSRPFPWNRTNFQVQIRVNPMLPLELDLSGCSLRIYGGEAGAQIRLIASSMKADRLRGPLVLEAITSSVKGQVVPSGHSRITAQQSSVRLALLTGTDLRIRATNQMSNVVLPGRNSHSTHRLHDADRLEHVIGSGRDELDVEAVMSSVVLASVEA